MPGSVVPIFSRQVDLERVSTPRLIAKMKTTPSVVTAILAYVSLATTVLAHPGETYTNEKMKKAIAARDLAAANAMGITTKCASSAKHQALQGRAAARRSMAAQVLREKRGVVDRK